METLVNFFNIKGKLWQLYSSLAGTILNAEKREKKTTSFCKILYVNYWYSKIRHFFFFGFWDILESANSSQEDYYGLHIVKKLRISES